MDRRNKIIVLVCVVLLVFFIQNLAFAGQRQVKKQEEAKFQANIQQIQTYSNEIEAALLYEDFEKAQTTYNQIEDLVKQLPQNTRERIDKTQQMVDINQQLKNRVWLIQDLGVGKNIMIELNQKLNSTPVTFAAFKNKTFAIAGSQNIILGTNDKYISVTSTPITTATNINDKASIFVGKDNAYRCDEKNCTTLQWDKPSDLANAKAIGTYVNRAYILDNITKKIYRFNIVGNSLNNTKQWNKSSDNLDKVSSLFVDTAIHLAIGATVEKWSGGNKESGQTFTISPALNYINQVIGGEKNKYLWLFDKENKRLVAINPTTNKVAQQLTSELFGQTININIDEAAKTIYLLTDQNVVELNYKQFGK